MSKSKGDKMMETTIIPNTPTEKRNATRAVLSGVERKSLTKKEAKTILETLGLP